MTTIGGWGVGVDAGLGVGFGGGFGVDRLHRQGDEELIGARHPRVLLADASGVPCVVRRAH